MAKAIEATLNATLIGIEATGKTAVIQLSLSTPDGKKLFQLPPLRVTVGESVSLENVYAVTRIVGSNELSIETVIELPEKSKSKAVEALPAVEPMEPPRRK